MDFSLGLVLSLVCETGGLTSLKVFG